MSGARPRLRRRTIGAIAATAAGVVIIALAVVWPGYDTQRTPVDDGSVWALQRSAGGNYARVNVEVGELDTVKQVSQPTALAQADTGLWMFTSSATKLAALDPGRPADLTAQSPDLFQSTPAGTRHVVTAGSRVAYLTEAGELFVGSLTQASPRRVVVTPNQTDGSDELTIDAVALTPDGVLAAYSAGGGAVVRVDADTGAVRGIDLVPDAPADAEVTIAGNRWALFDAATGRMWLEGRAEVVATGVVAPARLATASDAAGAVFIADAGGLIAVSPDDGSVGRSFAGANLGTPAAPLPVAGDVFAAWLPQSGSGTLWSRSQGERSLDFAGQQLGADVLPEFAAGGGRVILNETVSGWVWTVPTGALIASSQAWQLDDRASTEQADDVEAPVVLDPRPPVAEDDAFGVRAGTAVRLPVLLNDHDPNRDVLSIAPGSISTSTFGTPVQVANDQSLMLDVSPDATGTTTFTYRVTDGTTAEGLQSNTATVTLTVVPPSENAAPVWCGVTGCLATWPSPAIAPGGTVSLPVLDGFVDPDGDPIYLAGAEVVSGSGAVTADPAGVVTFQHPDPNDTATTMSTIALTVSDDRGARVQKNLVVTISPGATVTADDFAQTVITGRPVTVTLAEHVRGGSGHATLSAVTSSGENTDVTINPTGLSFTYRPTTPGPVVLQYTVRDGDAEHTATARITAVDPAQAPVAAPPLLAFVRPGEDTTVDVAGAAFNPAHLVLLVSDLRPEPASGATLSVDPVGQSTVRASGTTAEGEPGRLGTVGYTLSDGTGNPATTVSGTLTVIQLAPAGAVPPIAVNDTATVRTGGQIDIPVLANDSAPAGGLIAIDPATIQRQQDAGLAFATSRVLRYLAPPEPGVYTVSYTIFRLGYPELTASALVTITVRDDTTNTAPAPRTLEGRALSGRSTTIPFDGFGIDPDGDAVVLDAVLDQPLGVDGAAAGTAAISPDGAGLVYTAPLGWSGQASFRYQVRDARGATAQAVALIGVRQAQSDPRPVTFSDYVQIEGGAERADNEVVVLPLDNDVDPAGGKLTLTDVRPNAQPDSPEYSDMAALIRDVDTRTGAVTLRAGATLGTYSFVYGVSNAAGDTGAGLIVLKVVRNPVSAYPEVRDTILTAETVDTFSAGVDVLTGAVTWAGGDPAGLTLSLWQEMPGIRVEGSRISGSPAADPLVIPFSVTGVGFDGRPVTSYGFLRVPGENELRPALRAGTAPLVVTENTSAEIDLGPIVAAPRGASVEFDTAVSTGGARSAASCELVAPGRLRYTAGAGAPWSDTCVVPARLSGQTEWTRLSLPVTVVAERSQPILGAASRTLSPGQTDSLELRQLTTWTGQPDWPSLRYEVSYSGDQFVIQTTGETVQVLARDDARPGRTETLTVRLASHPDIQPAIVTLAVGPAPSTLPKAGTVTRQCSQAGGTSSCTIVVVGAAGEVNPLPGTPLRLVSVTEPANCPAVTFSVDSATSVRASWSTDAPGAADCTGTFVLADAQGRLSAGERVGTVVLDLRGLPANASSVQWSAFDATSVTLRVLPGASSYPAVDGYSVAGGGIEVRCDADGRCPAIPAQPGVKTAYTATALNAVGSARSATSPVTAWAYVSPRAPSAASSTAVPTSDGSGGLATLTVTGLDPTTGSVRATSALTGAVQTVTVPAGASSVDIPSFAVGANSPTTVTITPVSRFELPPIASGSTDGSTLETTAWGVGAPRVALTLTPSVDGSGEVTARIDVGANGTNVTLWAGVSTSGTCTLERIGDTAATTITRVLSGTAWQNTTATACAEYRIDGTAFGRTTTDPVTARPTEPLPAPTGTATYTIDAAPTIEGRTARWDAITGPSFPHPRYETRYGPSRVTDFTTLFTPGTDPGSIQAYWCVDAACSSTGTTVTPTGAAYTATVTFPTTCDATGAPNPTQVAARTADYAVTTESELSSDGFETLWKITVTWSGRLAGLNSYTYTGLACPAPTP